MKRFLLSLILYFFVLFPLSVFAQNNQKNTATSQEQMENAVLKIKTNAQKVLAENAQIKNHQEALKRKQVDLEKQWIALSQEIEKVRRSMASGQKIIQRIEQKTQRAENYFNNSEARLKVLEIKLQGSRQKIAYAQEQNRKLQEQSDQLQAQRESVASYDQAAEQKRFLEEASPVIKEMDLLRKKMHDVRLHSKINKKRNEQSQKVTDLVRIESFENKAQSDAMLLNLSRMLHVDRVAFQNVDLKKKKALLETLKEEKRVDKKEIQPEELIKQLRDFSLFMERTSDQENSSSDHVYAYRAVIKEKNNLVINEIRGLEKGQRQSKNDLRSLAQKIESLAQLASQEQAKNEKLREKIVKLRESKQATLGEVDRLTLKSKRSMPQDPAQQEVFLKEQAQVLAAQNQKFLQSLSVLESKKQKATLAMEQELEKRIRTVETENKILNNRLTDLSERIAKVQQEKSLLESLLRQQKQDYSGMKVRAESGPARSSQSFGPARTLWKTPEILQE
jgi:hypothetical protein